MQQNTPESSNHATIKGILPQSDPEVMIRSSHPAIDRLIALEAAGKKTGGTKYEKTHDRKSKKKSGK